MNSQKEWSVNRNRLIRTAGLILLAASLWACGDEEQNNNGSSNIVPGNNSTSMNNATTNVMTNNNTSTPNNGTTGNNNPVTTPDCVALNPALEGECDVLCQSGCTASQACSAQENEVDPMMEEIASWSTSCAAPGDTAEGQSCTANTDCQQGYACADRRDGGGLACLQYCRTGGIEAPQCAQGLECVPFRTELRLGTCQEPLPGCTVFPDSCGDGEQCYEPTDGTSPVCVTFGDVDLGEPCEAIDDCQEELRCHEVPGTGKICVQICPPDDPDADRLCRDETTCNVVSGDVSWGACY